MSTTDLAAAAAEANATAAAEAAAQVLPAVEPLTVGPAQSGSPHVTAAFARAAVADLEAPVPGRIAVLVGHDLVTALDNSPLGGLDLHAAILPTLEAVAGQLGSRARSARTVELEAVVGELGGSFTTVPLIGIGIDAAVLVTDDALAGAREPVAEPEPVVEPQAAAQPVPAFTAPLEEPGARPYMASVAGQRGLEMLHGVDMEVTVELGRTRMTVRDLLALSPGAVLELDRAAGSPADLLVNGRLIARGEVVVVDEDFGLRVTEILDDAAAV
ncbi:flagellar motor switch protein FliN [Nocardioides sp. CER19]|uniref:flagellar motor switch protein FliN n=1 Tax=Nocardioides sp. CER19 TaxID=3038538 RepID=UPI00244749CB|nr:flagellar motor switch protein FliN [Nocardioides sp. CER19]MDH2414617.1 flagellar motor switch protein FliN [Nocardioides sp. CER19]